MYFWSMLSAATCQTSLDTTKMSMLLSLPFSLFFFFFKFRITLLDFESRTAFLTSNFLWKKGVRQKLSSLSSEVCLATAALFLAYLPSGLKTFLNVWDLWSCRGLLKCSHHFTLPSNSFSGDEGWWASFTYLSIWQGPKVGNIRLHIILLLI